MSISAPFIQRPIATSLLMAGILLVGMVAFPGQWWLDARKPRVEQVAAHLIDLAWNGLSQLDAKT